MAFTLDAVDLAGDGALELHKACKLGAVTVGVVAPGMLCAGDALQSVCGDVFKGGGFLPGLEHDNVTARYGPMGCDPYQAMHAVPAHVVGAWQVGDFAL